MNKRLFTIYQSLLQKHGDPVELWPQWCSRNKDERLRQLVAMGAILVQRTNWRNADIALRNLKKTGLLSLDALASEISPSDLAVFIKPAVFHTTKPRRLIEFSRFVTERYASLTRMRKVRLPTLRKELLNVYGIGPETADTILLYALDMPSFVVDEYTRRWLRMNNITGSDRSYDSIKQMFESSLPQKVTVYQNFHILLIAEQKSSESCKMGVV